MIKPGEEWGRPTTAAPDLEVAGGDADLAAAVAANPGALVRFRPDSTSDFAGAVGLGVAEPGRGLVAQQGTEVTLDLLRLDADRAAVNMLVLGTPPDSSRRFVRRFGASVRVDERTVFLGPCTAVVIAIGQFRRGLDLVPRGHPGDGRAEVQIYAVPGRDRRALRARLATGTHVPHPDITQRSGARVTLTTDRRVPLEIDGRAAATADALDVEVVPNAYRLLL
jgi:diacylglycerol kinase family enzyme